MGKYNKASGRTDFYRAAEKMAQREMSLNMIAQLFIASDSLFRFVSTATAASMKVRSSRSTRACVSSCDQQPAQFVRVQIDTNGSVFRNDLCRMSSTFAAERSG